MFLAGLVWISPASADVTEDSLRDWSPHSYSCGLFWDDYAAASRVWNDTGDMIHEWQEGQRQYRAAIQYARGYLQAMADADGLTTGTLTESQEWTIADYLREWCRDERVTPFREMVDRFGRSKPFQDLWFQTQPGSN